MSDSWENAVEIRRVVCDHCGDKGTCEAAYDPDKPCTKDLT